MKELQEQLQKLQAVESEKRTQIQVVTTYIQYIQHIHTYIHTCVQDLEIRLLSVDESHTAARAELSFLLSSAESDARSGCMYVCTVRYSY